MLQTILERDHARIVHNRCCHTSLFRLRIREQGDGRAGLRRASAVREGRARSSIGVSVATRRFLRALHRPLQLPFNDLCPFWALIIGENRRVVLDFGQVD